MTARAHVRWFALVATTLLGGCDAPPSIRVEPQVVRVTPADLDLRVDLVNDGPAPVAVSQLRIEGEDWTAFAIQNERNPDAIPAAGRAPLTIRVTRRAFSTAGHDHGYASYRPGHAELAATVGDDAIRTPIEFEPAPRLADQLWASLLSLLLLALGLGGAHAIRRGLRRRLSRNDEARPPETRPETTADEPRGFGRTQLVASVVGMGLLAAAWATIPIGDAVCVDRLGGHAYGLDLAQCRRGSGGGPLTLAAVDGGLALWWAALAAYMGAGLLGPAGERARVLRTGFGPLAVIALAAAGPCVVHGSLDPDAIVRAQLADDHSVAVWAWGAFSQPVAALLAILALARLTALFPRDPAAPLSRLPISMMGPDGLAAAAIVTLFFGGWSVPTVPPLGHAALIGLGAAAFAVKLGCVTFVAQALAARAGRSPLPGQPPGTTPTPTLGWPVLLALALANLGATIAIAGA